MTPVSWRDRAGTGRVRRPHERASRRRQEDLGEHAAHAAATEPLDRVDRVRREKAEVAAQRRAAALACGRRMLR